MSRFRVRPRLLVAVAAVIVVIGIPGFARVAHFESLRLDLECADNLRTIGAALRAYALESPDLRFPPLSRIPGRLLFHSKSVYPRYLNDHSALVSPAHPDGPRLRARALASSQTIVDDHSYWYPGYFVLNRRSMQAFVDDYKAAIETGEPIAEVDDIWPEYAESVERRREQLETIDHHAGRGEFSYAEARRLSALLNMPPSDHERHLRLGMRIGMEGFLMNMFEEPDGYESHFGEQPSIPLLIERPELHGDGGHVLYLDGHVEFVPYPGKFPMTKEYIAALRVLDDLEIPESEN